MSIETIVVGIDGSDSAAVASAWAADLAKQLGAELIAVHAFARHPLLDSDTNDDLYAAEQLEFVREWCAPIEAADVSFELVMEVADPRDLLLTISVRRDADLIVLGDRGRSAVASLLIGSVTGYVTQHSSVPIAVVPFSKHSN